MKNLFLALATVTSFAAPAAHAASFSFLQEYSELSTFSGVFEGEDLNGDGQINAFDGEISLFSAVFPANSFVPTLEFDLSNLFGLILDLDGSNILGDSGVEGLAVFDPTGQYVIGVGTGALGFPCDGSGPCGQVSNGIFGGTVIFDETSDQLRLVNAPVPIPLPASGLLLVGAMSLMAARRRK